jgi:mRNA deadenylase 3'-5' endonuclease subunit Ccr4
MALPNRQWLGVDALHDDGLSLRVLHWNTLADSLVDSFPHVKDKHHLTWQHRSPLLAQEVSRHGADVLSLCEVDHVEHFNEAMAKQKRGYQSVHQPKPAPKLDGVCLYVPLRMTLHTEKFAYRDIDPHYVGKQVACITVLRVCPDPTCFAGPGMDNTVWPIVIVASTHLKAKTGLAQRIHAVRLLMSHIDKLSLIYDATGWIVCGDFNDVPTSKPCEMMRAAGYTSVYTRYPSSTTEPYTTAKRRESVIVRTIDYIWVRDCERLSIDVKRLLAIPGRLDAFPEYLPCKDYPSDHLAIGVDLGFRCLPLRSHQHVGRD